MWSSKLFFAAAVASSMFMSVAGHAIIAADQGTLDGLARSDGQCACRPLKSTTNSSHPLQSLRGARRSALPSLVPAQRPSPTVSSTSSRKTSTEARTARRASAAALGLSHSLMSRCRSFTAALSTTGRTGTFAAVDVTKNGDPAPSGNADVPSAFSLRYSHPTQH